MSYSSDFQFVSSVEATVHSQPLLRYQNITTLQKEVEISPAIAAGYDTLRRKPRPDTPVPEHAYKLGPVEHLERQPNRYEPFPESLNVTETIVDRPDHFPIKHGSDVIREYLEGFKSLNDLTSPEPSVAESPVEPASPTSTNSRYRQEVSNCLWFNWFCKLIRWCQKTAEETRRYQTEPH